MIGKTLGHYQITNQLGKGGMGEVFQAKDQVLGRDVAIKVLPEEFSGDADRVARFQREAKILASLNHPNIAAVYGLEEVSGINFLSLELVGGKTLADRIKAGPITVEEALKLALQIAEALEAAHEKGIIHRDLKPSNIQITPDGTVKVLDFGLAKACAGEQEINLSNSPTLSDAATQKGVILGTAAYMSPEQARGKTVDRRADIWAYGCVLYEMLTGHPAFSGQDVTEILAAVIRAEPEWSTLPAKLHWRLREVLERCLRKDTKNRYHDISDVRIDIEKVLKDPSGASGQPMVPIQTRSSGKLLWFSVLALTAVVVGLVIWNLKPTPPPETKPVTRLSYDLPKDYTTNIAVSPNGRQFVYGSERGFYLRSLDELDARLIPGTEGKSWEPFFSPDGKWLGYFGGDFKLKKVSISGGTPIELCGFQQAGGATWNTDNTILFSDLSRGIMRIPDKGGNPGMLIKGNYYAPQLLPGGKSVLFTDVSSQPYRVLLQSLQTGERKELFAGLGAQYVSTGHIVFASGQSPFNLMATLFNLQKLETTGGSVPVVDSLAGGVISDTGTLVYIPAAAKPAIQHVPVWVDQKGKEAIISGAPNNVGQRFSLSPDGTRVAFMAATGGNADIWIWDLGRETVTRLTFEESVESFPLWTLDGKRVVYESNVNNGQSEVNLKAADGTGAVTKLGSFSFLPGPSAWSGSGKELVLAEVGLSPLRGEITMLAMEGEHSRTPLIKEKLPVTQPKVSPDGKWIAYVSVQSGKPEIFVRPFPEVDKGKWQVSTTGGIGPLWSPDGRKIFYRSGDCAMAVGVETAPSFRLGKPEILFRSNYYYWGVGSMIQPVWDIRPDGKGFMMIKEVDSTATSAEVTPKINVVVNWLEELKQRVPVK
jgi:serine/threonine protein kinase/Tol biopolymer transport system component